MMNRKGSITFFIISLALVSYASLASAPSEGIGTVSAGYIFTDEDGNLAVNQETFNLYDGVNLSLSDFRYLFSSGINISADLDQASLDNRNLRGAIGIPGHLGLSVRQSNYRRVYGYDGTQSTRRRMSGLKFHLTPMKFLRFDYGYRFTAREGEITNVSSPLDEIVINAVDYNISEYNVGLRAHSSSGSISAEIRKLNTDVKTNSNRDRQAESFNLNGSSRIPNYDWLTLSGGYYHRTDELENLKPKITTRQGWGGLRGFLPRDYFAEYRFLFARTDNAVSGIETDNAVNTIAVGRDWPSLGSIRIGYENRIADDLTDRTEANLLLFSGWWQATEKINLRARVTTRQKRVKTGATLRGDEDYTHHRITVNYLYPDWGRISFQWEDKTRTNDDIDTRIDYNSLGTRLSLNRTNVGRIKVAYAYNWGEYDNRSVGGISQYRFADHILNGSWILPTYRNLRITLRGYYYRSTRDRDFEKSKLGFSLFYNLPHDYAVEGEYQAYNFDDYTQINRYYTGNIVKVKLAKNFSF